MSAYLKFFELEQSPFEGKAQSQVVLGTRALRDAFGTLRSGLDEEASRLCVSGAAGLGKTSLARALPKLLGDEVRVAHVPDAGVGWAHCRGAIARQWGLVEGRLARAALVDARAHQRLVLVIDRAERADEDFLDHLDVLLSYRTEADTPVVQSVLLANLATAAGDTPAPLLWWLDRIQTLQLEFEPLPRDGVTSYIAKHLRRAGWRGEALFSEEAGFAIHGYAGGVPGQISALCEKLLVEAASRGRADVDADFVHAICDPQPEDEASEAGWPRPGGEEPEALGLFASAGGTRTEEATEDDGPPPIELADVVEHPDGAARTSPQDDDEPWTFAIDEADTEADPASLDEPRPDAALAPEPAPPAPPEDPLLDDGLTGFEGLPASRSRKPVALAALAAAVAGGLFLSLGGSESPTPEPPPRVAKKEAPKPAPVLATPGQGYVDPSLIERLPRASLADAIAAAEAQMETRDTVRTQGRPARFAAPMRNATEGGPEAARIARNGPPVKDEATTKSNPTLVPSASSAEESAGIDATSTSVPKRALLDSTGVEADEAAMPAAPSAPSATGEEGRFW